MNGRHFVPWLVGIILLPIVFQWAPSIEGEYGPGILIAGICATLLAFLFTFSEWVMAHYSEQREEHRRFTRR